MRKVGEYIRNNLPEDKYPMASDDDVVIHYQNGECSFDQVLLRYHERLVHRSRQNLPGIDDEDIYQELVIKLNHACNFWRPGMEVSFNTYLYSTCTNHLRYIIRRQYEVLGRKANYKAESLDEVKDTTEDGAPSLKWELSVDFEIPIEVLLDDLALSDRERRIIQGLLAGYNKAELAKMEVLSPPRITQIVKVIGRRIADW